MFLENIEPFLGNGQLNEAGQDLRTFLEEYDPKKYDSPCSTVDMAVVAYEGDLEKLKILMIQRRNHPSIGMWALPGGFVELREDLDTAAERELEEETGVTGIPLVQIGTYGAVDRDPRTRIITTLYLALIHQNQVRVKAGDDAADAVWYDVQLQSGDMGKNGQQYLLSLENRERNLALQAIVETAEKRTDYIVKHSSSVIQSQGIAADHAALITDVLLRIEEIKERK